ncbi:hypothetical protein [Streptomyces sp. NPDC002133]|uniref:hypothetical protein n=1 Tax=Streptomyces sp. NPDC002133 TaxID=3154409 RepID=UPI00331AC3CD
MKSALATATLAAALVGVTAPSAAAWDTVKQFSFTDEGVGATTGFWNAKQGNQQATQDACATSNGAQGRVGYDFNIQVTLEPDKWIAWRDWSCDNSTYWKQFAYSNTPGGRYYMEIESAPAFIHSAGRINYDG